MKMVRYTLETLPELTESDMADLRALAELPDSEIDLSDIPEVTPEQMKHARRGMFFQGAKKQVTATVDADVLAWVEGHGADAPSLINDVLRREMLAETQREAGSFSSQG